MSWFDSSFSLAKNAFSQAQKSIDKVLDIKEHKAGQESLEEPRKLEINTDVRDTNIRYIVYSRSDALPSSVETANAKSSKSPFETKSFSNPHTPHRTDTQNSTPPPTHTTFDSTWGQSDSVWGTPFTSPPSKGSGSKDSSSKVTLPASSQGSSTVKITPTGHRTKPRRSKSHATSTPIGTGGGVGGGDVQGLTPVKPIDEGLSPTTDKSTDSNIMIASDDGNEKNEHLIDPSDKNTELIAPSTTPKEASTDSRQNDSSLDGDTQLDISKRTVTALPLHDSQPSAQSNSIGGGSGEVKVADKENKEEPTASVNENLPSTCMDASVPMVKDAIIDKSVSKDTNKVEADTSDPVTGNGGLHDVQLSVPKEVADPLQSHDIIDTVSEGDATAGTLTGDSNEGLQTLTKVSYNCEVNVVQIK